MTIRSQTSAMNEKLKAELHELETSKVAELAEVAEGDENSRLAIETKYEALKVEAFAKIDAEVKRLKEEQHRIEEEERRLRIEEEKEEKFLTDLDERTKVATNKAEDADARSKTAEENADEASARSKMASKKADSAKKRASLSSWATLMVAIVAGIALYFALINKDQADKVEKLDNELHDPKIGLIASTNKLAEKVYDPKTGLDALATKVGDKVDQADFDKLQATVGTKADGAELAALAAKVNNSETGLDTKISEARANEIFTAQCDAEKAAQDALREKRRLAQKSHPNRPTLEQTIVKVVEENFDVRHKSTEVGDNAGTEEDLPLIEQPAPPTEGSVIELKQIGE